MDILEFRTCPGHVLTVAVGDHATVRNSAAAYLRSLHAYGARIWRTDTEEWEIDADRGIHTDGSLRIIRAEVPA